MIILDSIALVARIVLGTFGFIAMIWSLWQLILILREMGRHS